MSIARHGNMEIAEYRDGTRIRQYDGRGRDATGITLTNSEYESLLGLLSDKEYVILCKRYGHQAEFFESKLSSIPRDCEFIILNSKEIASLKEAIEIYSNVSRHYK